MKGRWGVFDYYLYAIESLGPSLNSIFFLTTTMPFLSNQDLIFIHLFAQKIQRNLKN